MAFSSRRVKGYTLIEILIVLFIISIVTSVALLSISHNENRQVQTFANELTQELLFAEEQAMLQPSVLGLTLTGQSFQFSSYQLTADGKKQVWTPFTDTVLGKHPIPDNIQVSLKMNGKDEAESSDKNIPQIIISTNGDLTPFTIYVGKQGQKPLYAIFSDGNGNVTNQSLSS